MFFCLVQDAEAWQALRKVPQGQETPAGAAPEPDLNDVRHTIRQDGFRALSDEARRWNEDRFEL